MSTSPVHVLMLLSAELDFISFTSLIAFFKSFYLFFFLQSLVTVGAMFGSLIGGWTIDYLGRKGTVIACVLPFELGWLLIAFGKNHAMLYAGRTICGLACGIVSLSVPVS